LNLAIFSFDLPHNIPIIMKKIIILTLFLILGTQIAQAQNESIPEKIDKVESDLSPATLLRVHLPLNESHTTGLTEPSDVIVDQIRSIDNQRLIKKLGELPSAQAEQLQKSLQTILAV